MRAIECIFQKNACNQNFLYDQAKLSMVGHLINQSEMVIFGFTLTGLRDAKNKLEVNTCNPMLCMLHTLPDEIFYEVWILHSEDNSVQG